MDPHPKNEPDEREETIFEAALQLPASQRAAYLDRTCVHEPELRRRVEGLLGAFDRAAGLFKEPAVSSTARTLISPRSAIDQLGDRIGRYKLLQRIGEGGCGVVYIAEQEEPVRRKVALKVIKLGMDTQRVVARFEAERQALALMDHPNIAKVYDAGATDAGRPYFVMELVRGLRITDYCDQNNLSAPERLDLFIQVCQAVQHAHQKGIIHRDLKPSNILVSQHDTVAMPKVIDFGIAKVTTDQRLNDKTLFTAFEQFIGTPAYMSPEQAQLNGRDIDTRTDIYSLGVLLYELLTGRTPFDAKEWITAGLDQICRTIREGEPIKPSTRLMEELASAEGSPGHSSTGMSVHSEAEASADARRRLQMKAQIALLRGDLDWIVMKCLEKDRSRRYETASGLALDIQRHLHQQPVVARPPTVAYRYRKWVQRNKLVFTAATVVTTTLIIGISVSTWQAVRATTAFARANKSLYAANMRLAQFAWEKNNAAQVRQLLRETESYPERGFEWHYWQRQTHLQLDTLRGHSGAVLAVATSPDGRWIATGSQDGTARIWAAGGSEPPRTLASHVGQVSSVAFSPDSQRIVTGSWDHTARVWETISGRLLLTLNGHGNKVFSVTFSPDGQRIITGSQDGTAKVWDAFTGREKSTLGGHSGWVCSATFSTDGRRIITGSQDGTAKVRDASTAAELHTFRGHGGPVYSVAVSPDSQRVATGGGDLTVRVWDIATGQELVPPLRGHSDSIHAVAFSHDGARLATGSYDQTVKVWNPANGTELFTVRGHGSPISSVAFSPDSKRLVTGGGSINVTPLGRSVGDGLGDGLAKVWSALEDLETLTLRGHTGKVMAVAFSPDGQRVITGSLDTTATVWDTDSGKEWFALKGHRAGVRAVAFSPDGQRVATCDLEGAGWVWAAASGKPLVELSGHSDRILAVAFSPDSQRIVTGSGDQTARVWSAVDGEPLANLAGHEGWIFSAAFSPDGQWIVTGSNDGKVRICDATTGKRLRVFTGKDWGVNGVAFSPDGRRIVTGCGNGIARIWDTLTVTQLFALGGHSFEIYSVAFSPDGTRVVTAGKDRTAKVWDASNGQELLTLAGHDDEVWAVAFSRDGRRIVTGSWDGTAKIWQTMTRPNPSQWRTKP